LSYKILRNKILRNKILRDMILTDKNLVAYEDELLPVRAPLGVCRYSVEQSVRDITTHLSKSDDKGRLYDGSNAAKHIAG